jgi:hypothetical protein
MEHEGSLLYSREPTFFSMPLPPHSGPRPLIQYRNHFTLTVGLLGRVISPSQGHYVNTGQHRHRINAHTDIHALIGIRTKDPSVRGSEGSSCLRPVFLNHRAAVRYRALASNIPGPPLIKKNLPGRGLTKVENPALDRAATVTGTRACY